MKYKTLLKRFMNRLMHGTGSGLLLFVLLSSVSLFAQTPVQVVIGPTAGTGSWFYGPIFRNTTNAGTLNYSRYAYLYTASELNIPSGARIVKVEWLKKDGGTIAAPNTFNVWMMNTTSATLPSTAAWSTVVSGATQTYASTTFALSANANEYVSAPFNVPGSDSFTYTGGNLQILTDWGKFGTQTNAGINFYILTATGKGIGLASSAALTGASTLQTTTYGGFRPTIRITYVPVPACNGIPVTGNAISSSASVCSGVSFTLSIQNTLSGTGISYLWQRASDAAFTSNLTSIGTSSTVTTSETSSFYYRCIATCSASAQSYTSPYVYVPRSPHYNCYCPSTATSAADEEIYNFTFGSLNNSSNCSTLASGTGSVAQLYSNYQYITPPNVEKLSTVPFSIQVGTCLSQYPNRCAIFIDYDHNGVFDASEEVYASASTTTGAHIEAGTILIPSTALTGLTGLRVINSEQSAPITNPCLVYSWGETEDYLINITPTTLCSGAPSPGNTIATSASVCSGATTTLSLQNLTTGQGVSYQWYKDGVAISGATSFTYTTAAITFPTTYYCGVTCTNSGQTTNSTPLGITMNSFIDCYCMSQASSDADEDIFSFTIKGVTTSTDCSTAAPGPGSILGRYSNFYPLGTLVNLDLGATVPFDIYSDDCDQAPYYSFGTSIWIDFNHNGSYSDPGEQVFIENVALEGPRHIIGNIVIPCTAQVGQTGMRVTIAEGLSGSTITPCLMYGFGETEDYKINLKYPDTCSVVSNPPGNTQGTITSFCDSASSVLTLQNKCMFANFSYQWYKGDYPGTIIPGATAKTYTTPMLNNTTTYYCSVSCGSSTVISTPLTIPRVILNPTTTETLGGQYCIGGTPVHLSTTHTYTGLPTPATYTYLPTTGLSATSGNSLNATPATTTTYTVRVTDANGCYGTSTFTVAATHLSVGVNASAPNFCLPNGTPVTISSTGGVSYTYVPSTGLSIDTGSTVYASPAATTTYVVTGTSATGCTGTNTITITAAPCSITLNLKAMIQGYYDAGGLMKPVLMNQGETGNALVADSIDIELHDPIDPTILISSKRVLLNLNGTATVAFPGVVQGPYYIALRHRNAVQTWSANPVNIIAAGSNYDFTTAASQAFGDNQILVDPGIWAIYSGDPNQDDNVDLFDIIQLEVDIDNFIFGYVPTDLNGDGNTDLLDVPLLENNVNDFIYSNHP